VALFLVASSAFGVLTSWWYARKVTVRPCRLPLREIITEARGLLGMGAAFLTSGLLVAGVDYLTRVLIVRELGMDAVGLYNATWTLSSLYVGIVLQAMGADFYPRLTGVANNDAALNLMVNEQSEMGILIAIPGILATLTLAPWVLKFFYSAAFVPAVEIIRWQIIGIALRVISWPMGFVQLAKGMSGLFMATETIFSILHVGLLFVCMRLWGLDGVGISFMALYIAYTFGMLGVCRYITGFLWTNRVTALVFLASVMVAATLLAVRVLPKLLGTITGLVITGSTTVFCVFMLQKLLNINILHILLHKRLKASP
jgi:enterobacterial common antigen flippase